MLPSLVVEWEEEHSLQEQLQVAQASEMEVDLVIQCSEDIEEDLLLSTEVALIHSVCLDPHSQTLACLESVPLDLATTLLFR